MRWRIILPVVLVLSVAAGLGLARHWSASDADRPAHEASGAEPDGRMSTGDGRLSFTAPSGWTQRSCPSGVDDCTQVSPPGASDGDTVSVMAGGRNPVEGTPVDLLLNEEFPLGPSQRRLTVDGAKAVRLDLSQVPGAAAEGPGTQDVLVIGVVPGSTDQFMIGCRHDRLAAEVRAGCDLIVESLRFRR